MPQVLEEEEGREVAGLAVLVLHLAYMSSVLWGRAQPTPPDDGAASGAVSRQLVLGVAVAAAYMWWEYQPLMNSRCVAPMPSTGGRAVAANPTLPRCAAGRRRVRPTALLTAAAVQVQRVPLQGAVYAPRPRTVTPLR